MRGAASSFLGRSILTDYIDIGLVESWLDRCERYHKRSCLESGVLTLKIPRNFRLIDLYADEVIAAPAQCTYVAMSYYWVQVGWQMSTTRSTYARRAERGTFTFLLPSWLPNTIKDSMSLAKVLGFQYLWNDSLCIIQDDLTDLESQIARVDAIYTNAHLTIIAGSGVHADVGLHGISVPRRSVQHVESVQGLQLANILPRYHQVEPQLA